MNEKLIENWNKTVKKHDRVFHLGDFCFGQKSEEVAKLANRLNGMKSIILGNHDKYETSWYMEKGFIWASRFPIILGNSIILSHHPLLLDEGSSFRNIHGHLHQVDFAGQYHKNVSVEKIDYTPINYEDVKKEFNLRNV